MPQARRRTRLVTRWWRRLETKNLVVTPNMVSASDGEIVRSYVDAFGSELSVEETWARYCGELKGRHGAEYTPPAILKLTYEEKERGAAEADDAKKTYDALFLELKTEAKDEQLKNSRSMRF